jgi:hypothetical protein
LTTEEPLRDELAQKKFKLSETMNNNIKEDAMKDLLDLIKIKKGLRIRCNLSAPRLDGITNLILKREREKSSIIFIELMKMVMKI